MSASFNSVTVVGNLTRDVEDVATKSGTSMAKFGLAVNEKYKDKEETTFLDITLFGAQADIAKKYLKKGSSVLINGKIKQDSWEDKNGGGKRTKLYIVANELRMLGSKPAGERVEAGEQNENSPPF